MGRALKVFSLGGFARPKDGFEDGELDRHRQINMVVAATTKKRAAELFGASPTEMRDFSSITGNPEQCAKALSKPEQVFASAADYRKELVWREIERSPHVVTPRRPKVPYVAPPPKPSFTKKELEMIAERFAMANDPDGQTLAEKAMKMIGSKNV